MFKPIIRANKNRKANMRFKAENVAEELGYTFTGNISPNKEAAYTAEFISAVSDEPFYGWAVASVNNGEWEEKIDFAFGYDQGVFGGEYVITEEDYYEIIGAGI